MSQVPVATSKICFWLHLSLIEVWPSFAILYQFRRQDPVRYIVATSDPVKHFSICCFLGYPDH
jgi:hypothetical protein